jgi:hypothetical protein
MALGWDKNRLRYEGNRECTFTFEGKGFVLKGGVRKTGEELEEMDLMADVFIDGELYEEAVLPTDFQSRRHEITWRYNLENREHEVKVIWKNPTRGYGIDLDRVLIYGPVPSVE